MRGAPEDARVARVPLGEPPSDELRGVVGGAQLKGGVVVALKLMRGMLERGFIVFPAGEAADALSFTPPLTLTARQWDAALDALRSLLKQL
eukprot:652592-Pyramimonas_sp.AAC.1